MKEFNVILKKLSKKEYERVYKYNRYFDNYFQYLKVYENYFNKELKVYFAYKDFRNNNNRYKFFKISFINWHYFYEEELIFINEFKIKKLLEKYL